MKQISAVDLFCGAGGLTKGLEQEGVDVKVGFDLDSSCQYPYEKNNDAEFRERDIRSVDGDEIQELINDGDISLIAGCAPCQPFSSYGRKEKDEKWSLLKEFGRIVEESQPDLVTMENVARVTNTDIFESFVQTLEENGYFVEYRKVKSENYGVPQSRKRLILLASSQGPIELMERTHGEEEKRTVEDAIGDLEPIEAGEVSEEDPLHRAAGLSEKNLKRIRHSEPGGTWKDWPEELILDCHKKSSGKSYQSVYGRMEWNRPSPTITTQFYGYGSGRFGHPEQNRAISLREGAILQTFPEDYRFIDPEAEEVHKTNIGRLIGNAVPVKLARVIGKSFRQHISHW